MVMEFEARNMPVTRRRAAIFRRVAAIVAIGLLSLAWRAARPWIEYRLAEASIGNYQRHPLMHVLIPPDSSTPGIERSLAGSARFSSHPGVLYESIFHSSDSRYRLRILDAQRRPLMTLPEYAVIGESPSDRDGDGQLELAVYDLRMMTQKTLIVYRARGEGVEIVAAVRLRNAGARWLAPWSRWSAARADGRHDLVINSLTAIPLLSGDMATAATEIARLTWDRPGGTLVAADGLDWSRVLIADLDVPIPVDAIEAVSDLVEAAFGRARAMHPVPTSSSSPASMPGSP